LEKAKKKKKMVKKKQSNIDLIFCPMTSQNEANGLQSAIALSMDRKSGNNNGTGKPTLSYRPQDGGSGIQAEIAFTTSDSYAWVCLTFVFTSSSSISLGHGSADATTKAQVWAHPRHFRALWDRFERTRKRLWATAFHPGNAIFSGSLPSMVTSSSSVSKVYYSSCWSLVSKMRTNLVSIIPCWWPLGIIYLLFFYSLLYIFYFLEFS
jgi:hypothetical protein